MCEDPHPLVSELPTTSASRRVLDTPELLSRIFELAPPDCQVVAAQICRVWSASAFRYIWRDMESVVPLVNLFAPNKRKLGRDFYVLCSDSIKDFEAQQWERIRFYGRHIRSIAHDDRESIKIDISVFQKIASIALNRPTFLPNLRSLQWVVSSPSSACGVGVILSSSVKELQLFMDTDDNTTLYSKVLENLFDRTRKIVSLSLYLHPTIDVGEIEAPLSRLLRESSMLEGLKLPPYFLSNKIIASLESHSALTALEQTNVGSYKSLHNSSGCNLCFGNDNFSRLEKLSFNDDLEKAAHIFRKPGAPHNLTSIYIGTKRLATNSDLGDFLRVLVASNPAIQQVSLNLYADGTAGTVEQITFQEMMPLLGADLCNLTISHNHPLLYTPTDVITMREAWPNIALLYLNDEVIIPDTSSPPIGQDLSILHLFASFPLLTSLGIYFTVDRSFKILESWSNTRFKNLRSLSVGTSVLPDDKDLDLEEVALFLVSLMPNEGFEISLLHSDWYPKPTENDARNGTWDAACSRLPTCIRAQKGIRRDLEEREKELHKQLQVVECLRAREKDLLEELARLKAGVIYPLNAPI